MKTIKTKFATQMLRSLMKEKDWNYARLAYELSRVLQRKKPLAAGTVAYWLNGGTQPDAATVAGLVAVFSTESKPLTREDWYE